MMPGYLVLNLLTLTLLLALSSQSCHSGNGDSAYVPEKNVRPVWRVSHFIEGPHTTMDREEATTFLDLPLNIGPAYIKFGQETCQEIVLNRSSEISAKYFTSKFHTDVERINYTQETLTVIQTNCSIEGFTEFVRLKDRRLVVQIKGYLFILEPSLLY